MVLYNTLVGFCAGVVILTAADVARRYPMVAGPGHGFVLAVAGIPLTFLSAVGAITWPLTVNPPINVAFFEPSLLLGVLALGAAVAMLRSGAGDIDARILARLRPLTWLIFAVGLMLVSIASAVFSYNLVGDAPSVEPITGQLTGWENTTFGIVYLVAALGCLAAPRFESAYARLAMSWSWALAGAFFLLFSVLNFRTHIGLLMNTGTGTTYQW